MVISSLDIATSDGVNDKGLYSNTAWPIPSVLPDFNIKRPTLSLAAWLQYILDNFATVAEAVNALKDEPFDVVTAPIPGTDRTGALHVSLSDPSGDSANFEYVNDKLVIQRDPSYKVMTNDPIFEEQLAIKKYWEQIGGATMLPGTNRAADRFVRASLRGRHSEDVGYPRRGGQRLQRNPQLLCALRHLHAQPAAHCKYSMADGDGP
ncbi:MAG: hypothetical protein KatS3mg024_1234 [Armatimonadota bacterium]|nr:MAG: hypothetical protein KatS3mg024_1234 [Armatimonadota bacterium]